MPLMGGRPQPGFMDAVKTCMKEKYCCFKGRARRAEFWWFYLFCTIIGFVFGMIYTATALYHIDDLMNDPLSMYTSPAWIIIMLVSAVFWLPSLGVGVRRLHDTGRSGWWMVLPIAFYIPIIVMSILIIRNPDLTLSMGIALLLLYLALIVSGIILLVWLCQDSDRRENRYGRSPKYQ